jgi:hypothetical protein
MQVESGTGVSPVKSHARCAWHVKLHHYLGTQEFCSEGFRLCRLMCGRPLAFRRDCPFVWAMPNLFGRSPRFIVNWTGSAERFRTSGGRAAGVNQFLSNH